MISWKSKGLAFVNTCTWNIFFFAIHFVVSVLLQQQQPICQTLLITSSITTRGSERGVDVRSTSVPGKKNLWRTSQMWSFALPTFFLAHWTRRLIAITMREIPCVAICMVSFGVWCFIWKCKLLMSVSPGWNNIQEICLYDKLWHIVTKYVFGKFTIIYQLKI